MWIWALGGVLGVFLVVDLVLFVLGALVVGWEPWWEKVEEV